MGQILKNVASSAMIVQNLMFPGSISQLMEKVLGVTQARTEFSNLIERVQHQGDAYVFQRHGKPAAAVVPIQVCEAWERQRSEFFLHYLDK